MNVSTGIDLVPVARIAQYLADGGDPGAIWAPSELAECDGDIARLAGRWAAKEAVMKALRCGLAAVLPTDVVITSRDDGSPCVTLHGSALLRARSLGLDTWAISITHDAGLAVATAVAA